MPAGAGGEDQKELSDMKASRLSFSLFGAAVLLVLPTLAGNTVKKSLQINEKVMVEGVQLTPGNYKFEWGAPGPNVEVSILRGHDVVATVPAHMVEQNTPNEQTGYGLKPGAKGSQSLAEIFFSGERYELEIGQGSQTSTKSASSSGGAR
jgi:hypothetical protein